MANYALVTFKELLNFSPNRQHLLSLKSYEHSFELLRDVTGMQLHVGLLGSH